MIIRRLFMTKIISFLLIISLAIQPLHAMAGTEVIIQDPVPDQTPPELVSFNVSATEVPAGSSVQLTAKVTDDLSGVNSVRVDYNSPGSDMKYIYLQYNETLQQYEGTISFNEYESGEWKVYDITLEDKKNNYSYIYDDDSGFSGKTLDLTPYNILVTGGVQDHTAPVLHSITLSPTTQVTKGNTVQITADITDDISGVRTVGVVITKPTVGGVLTYLYYDQATGQYKGSLFIDSYDQLGTWKLSEVRLEDKASNRKSIYDASIPTSAETYDFSSQKFDVFGTTPDILGPVLDSLAISVEQTSNMNASVKLSAAVSDKLSGPSYIYADYMKPNGQYLQLYLGYNSTSRSYEGRIPIDKYDQLGEWKLIRISMQDGKQNFSQEYSGTEGSKYDFTLFNFTVLGAITIPPEAPFSLVVTPGTLTLEPGQSQQLKVVMTTSRNNETDVTNSTNSIYTSSDPDRIKVSSTGLVTVAEGAAPGKVYIQVENSRLHKEVEVVIPGETNAAALAIDPLRVTLSPTEKAQLKTIVTLPDGTAKEVTSGASGTTYNSLDTSAVTVDANGLISVLPDAKYGTVEIQVQHNGITGKSIVEVTAPPSVVGLDVAPDDVNIAVGETVQLNVRARMSDGSTKDVTSEAAYRSSSLNLMTVSNSGLVQPLEGVWGTADIRVSYGGKAVTKGITVKEPPSITSIELAEPIPTLIAPNGSYQISAVKANWSDGNVTSITTGVTYESSDTTKIKVSPTGLMEGVNGAKGSAYIYVKYSGQVLRTIVSLEQPATLSSIQLDTPIPSTLAQNGSYQISALTATWSDGTQTNVTTEAAYESSDSTKIKVSSTGLMEGVSGAVGGAYIYVKYGGKTIRTLVSLEQPATLLSIELTSPMIDSIAPTGSYQISAVKANWSDGTQTEVTAEASYESSDAAKITVSPTGLVEGVSGATGGAYIYVRYGGKVLRTLVSLEKPATLSSIQLASPIPSTIAQNGSYQISSVKAIWSDATQTDVSTEATYESSDTTKIKVSSTGLMEGVSGATGGAYIYVKYGGKVLRTLVSLEKPATLSGIQLASPIPGTLAQNGSYQISALTATWSDGTQTDVSSEAVYESSDITKIKVSSTGLMEGVSGAAGGAYIYVRYGGKVIRTLVSLVQPPTLLSIQLVSPMPSTIAKNGSYQITALKANWSDGTQTDITTGITYESSNSDRMTVSASGLIEAKPNVTGSAYISVKYGGKVIRTLISILSS